MDSFFSTFQNHKNKKIKIKKSKILQILFCLSKPSIPSTMVKVNGVRQSIWKNNGLKLNQVK